MDETDVALYRYNGLNMRLMWQDDADADSTLESSERFYVMFDERWRPVATFRDTDATPKEAFVWHAAGQGGFGGSSYIDSLILRDRDNYTGGTPNPMTSASDGTLEERRYFCQNWRADVVAVTKSDGTPLEYVRYSSYGEPTVYPVADLNMDGVVNSTDSSLWSDLLYSTSNASVYADSDLDFDGLDDWNSGGADGDLFYESYNENLGLSGVGRASSPGVDSRTGYASYQWDQTIGAYHVRYRVYLPDIGRWTRRDPLGYVDGMGLYQYGRGRSLAARDTYGLACLDECIAGCPWVVVPRLPENYPPLDGPRWRPMPGPTERFREPGCQQTCVAFCRGGAPTPDEGGCTPTGTLTTGAPNTLPNRSDGTKPTDFAVRFTVSGEDPNCCSEIGMVQLARSNYWGWWSDWGFDTGGLTIGSDSEGAQHPCYESPTAVRGGRAFLTLSDAPESRGEKSFEFVVVIMCTKGPGAGHVYGTYGWTITTDGADAVKGPSPMPAPPPVPRV